MSGEISLQSRSSYAQVTARIEEAIRAGRPSCTQRPDMKYLQIEITNHCDLRCVECPQRLMARHRQYMSPEVFEAICLRLLMDYEWETIIPHKDGEPLLHPQIRTILTCMSLLHAGKYALYSNGTHFSKSFYDFLRTLPNKTQVLLSFHFQGVKAQRTKETVIEEYRCEAAEDTLRQCIAEPADNIEFVLATHVTPYSDPNRLQAWRDRWEGLRASHPQISAVHVNHDLNTWAGHIDIGTSSFDACPYGSAEHFFVGVTGAVLPCCMDLNEELTLANITEGDMPAVLSRRAEFYARVAEPETRQPRCITCLGGAA